MGGVLLVPVASLFVGCWIGPLVGWLVGVLVGPLVGRLVGCVVLLFGLLGFVFVFCLAG